MVYVCPRGNFWYYQEDDSVLMVNHQDTYNNRSVIYASGYSLFVSTILQASIKLGMEL